MVNNTSFASTWVLLIAVLAVVVDSLSLNKAHAVEKGSVPPISKLSNEARTPVGNLPYPGWANGHQDKRQLGVTYSLVLLAAASSSPEAWYEMSSFPFKVFGEVENGLTAFDLPIVVSDYISLYGEIPGYYALGVMFNSTDLLPPNVLDLDTLAISLNWLQGLPSDPLPLPFNGEVVSTTFYTFSGSTLFGSTEGMAELTQDGEYLEKAWGSAVGVAGQDVTTAVLLEIIFRNSAEFTKYNPGLIAYSVSSPEDVYFMNNGSKLYDFGAVEDAGTTMFESPLVKSDYFVPDGELNGYYRLGIMFNSTVDILPVNTYANSLGIIVNLVPLSIPSDPLPLPFTNGEIVSTTLYAFWESNLVGSTEGRAKLTEDGAGLQWAIGIARQLHQGPPVSVDAVLLEIIIRNPDEAEKGKKCSAVWECSNVSESYNFVSCDNGYCTCKSGFVGEASSDNKCRCEAPSVVRLKEGVAYCL